MKSERSCTTRRLLGNTLGLLGKLFIGVATLVVFFIFWLATAWLYPDEWFADIPKFFLSLVGVNF